MYSSETDTKSASKIWYFFQNDQHAISYILYDHDIIADREYVVAKQVYFTTTWKWLTKDKQLF